MMLYRQTLVTMMAVAGAAVTVIGAVNTPEASRKFVQFPATIPRMTTAMLYPDFWEKHLVGSPGVILDAAELNEYNRRTIDRAQVLVDMNHYPLTRSRAEVLKDIRAASPEPGSARFFLDGRRFTHQDYLRREKNMNLAAITDQVTVRWALVTHRAALRTFPDPVAVVNDEHDPEVDMFLETGLNTGDVLAILHISADGQWFFVQRFNYRGWVNRDDVAIGSRDAVLHYADREPRLVITGARVLTAYLPDEPALSRRALDMGDSLPLAKERPAGGHIDHMSISGHWVIELPVRRDDGTLAIRPALISRNRDVNVGYLPYTRINLIRQAFKLAGERYGWGDAAMNRDCTGFVISVYRSMGLILPRNSSEQRDQMLGLTLKLRQDGTEHSDPAALDRLKTGDIFTSSSHVMLYLGKINGEHYVIHDSIELSYPKATGGTASETLRQIAVTPLLSVIDAQGRNYEDYFTTVRRPVLPEKAER
ncbi:MAG: NlpC/P60 family protein [Victivallales bacterium]|nr:NlpC/P60 family protein [Victivallales bacterium]